MDEPRKKRSFLSGLFRRRSDAQRNGKLQKQNQSPIREVEERDDLPSRKPKLDISQITGSRRRPRRPDPRTFKGKDIDESNGGGFYEQAPLTEWPPSGVSSQEELTLDHAVELISRGVPHFKGYKRPIPHASEQYYGLYSTTTGNYGDDDDAADLHYAMTQLMTLRMQGSTSPVYPWETLEQPSMAFGFGRRPGTISLNRWVGLSSAIPASIDLRDPGVGRREASLAHIFERLKELEVGLVEDDGDQMHRLYKRFFKDPDRLFSPRKPMEKQIEDLIMALSSEDWIDFTSPRNQVVTKFIYDTTSREHHEQYLMFFYQLLLSLELDLRINSRLHDDWAKERLINMIPPRIQWNLALARRWRHNIRIEEWGDAPDQVRLKFKLRKRQTKVLKRFAKLMKWPNLDATLDALRRRDAEGSSVTVSSHAMAFFSGLVLPGPTFPFLMMNALIDIDPDRATDDLALLTHLQPHCGFQHRNSYTYWTSSCIVGKVLAPTCREVAGWIGPAMPTLDLGRSQIARIRARKPRQLMAPEEVTSMGERSDPLGPPAEVYPVKEYVLLPGATDLDDYDHDRHDVDTIRIEQINLTAAKLTSSTTNNLNYHNDPSSPAAVGGGAGEGAGGPPKVFDASILFAIDSVSWPLNLHYDVSFVCAWPCSDGPHPLFFDYAYTAVRADEVVNVHNWGKPGASIVEPNARGKSAQKSKKGKDKENGALKNGSNGNAKGNGSDEDTERVLVVEAYGVSDNEVLARAWCAHWGLSAVVADVRRTCMACAIREAYAATLTVVILVNDHQQHSSGSE